MKITFVTHDIGMYGASRSLSLLVESLCENNFVQYKDLSLVYPRSLRKNPNISMKSLHEIPNKYSVFLPFSRIYKGGSFSPHEKFTMHLKGQFSKLFGSLGKILTVENPDFVHLNSVTLWPLLEQIDQSYKTIIHVREIIDLENMCRRLRDRLHASLRSCKLILCIDENTAIPLKKMNLSPFILRNPFDMRNARILRIGSKRELNEKYSLDMKAKKVVLIGRVEPIKGTSFFLDLADRFRNDRRVQFAVVGKIGGDAYSSSIKHRAAQMRNTFLLGEIFDIDEIYAIADAVIRCEAFLPLGRTVYEAYYSGVEAMVPVSQNDRLDEISQFIGKGITPYEARNIDDLSSKLKDFLAAPNTETTTERTTGNMYDYAIAFSKLISAEYNL